MEKSESFATNREFSIVIVYNVLISIITFQFPKPTPFLIRSKGLKEQGLWNMFWSVTRWY